MKILTLHEITNVLAAANYIETAEGRDFQISENLRAQIAYGLGHADGHIKKLEKVNAEILAKISLVMAPE